MRDPVPRKSGPGHRLDRLAIWLSGLCLVHCLLFPVFIAVMPALAAVLPQQWWVHPAILAVALPLAATALVGGWRRYHRARPLILGAVGLAGLVAGVFVREGSTAETLLTVAGGLTLASAHVLNWQLGRHRHDATGACQFG